MCAKNHEKMYTWVAVTFPAFFTKVTVSPRFFHRSNLLIAPFANITISLVSYCGPFSRPLYLFQLLFTRCMLSPVSFFPSLQSSSMFPLFLQTKPFHLLFRCRFLGYCFGAQGEQSSALHSVRYAYTSDSHSE